MKKIFSLIVIAFAMLVVGCTTSTSRVEWIEFTNVPNAEYVLNSNVTASQFAVTVKISGQEQEVYSLSNSALVVTGLVNGRLDTSTLGEKAVKVTYKGHSVTAYYRVVPKVGWVANTDGYDKSIDSAQELANLAVAVNNGEVDFEEFPVFELTADIDLDYKEWTPIGTDENPFMASFNGKGKVISNLVVTSASGNNNKGLFGVVKGTNAVFSDISLENVNIDATNSKDGEFGKNFGALIGKVDSKVTIEKVYVENAYIRGNGRIGTIFGVSYGVLPLVKDCNVYNSRISAYNPVTTPGNDGEGDKVGGILGQAQKGVTVENCSVNNVELVATRDVGGIAGVAHGDLVKLENNKVDANTTISSTADGGFLESKVSCNAGGLIGAIFVGHQYILNDNSVNTLNIYADENYGSMGNLVGGLRRGSDGIFNVSINGENKVYNYEQEAYSTWSDWLIGQQTILGNLGLSE